MVGDYISTSFGSDGLAHPAFAIANAPGGSVVASDPVRFTGSVGRGKSAFKRR